MSLVTYDQFKKIVEKYFLFLKEKYAFNLLNEKIKDNVYIISYLRGTDWVNILYSPVFKELDFSFGFLNEHRKLSFSINDLYINSSLNVINNTVEKEIAHCALLLMNNGVDFLSGNKASFIDIWRKREEKLRNQLKQNEIVNIKRLADTAWKDKKYVDVVELYKKIEDELSESEQLRFSISKKQIT